MEDGKTLIEKRLGTLYLRIAQLELAKPFLTGSYAFGTPGKDSDVDIVLELPQDAREALVEAGPDWGSAPPGSVSLKFGKLNLIIPDSEASWGVWVRGTAELVARKPVTRAAAVETLKRLRKAAGLT